MLPTRWTGPPTPTALSRAVPTTGHRPQRLGEHPFGVRVDRLVGSAGRSHSVSARMASPSLATARLAVDLTVPFDSPVASAISASDRPP